MSTESGSLAEALMQKHNVEPLNDSSVEEDTVTTESAAVEPVTASTNVPSNKSSGNLDINSLDAFPTLGGSNGKPSPIAPKPVWGGVNGQLPVSNSNNRPVAARSNAVNEVVTLKSEQQHPQIKQMLTEVLTKVKKNTDTAIESSTSRVTKNTTFIIKGLSDNVQRAKRDLLSELSVKVVKKIQVPASVRAFIIGSKGSNLKPIIQKSGTSIQVARKDVKESNNVDDEDEEELIDVTMEGDEEGIKVATLEILAIVSSRVRELTSKVHNVESRFMPFITSNPTVKKFSENGLKLQFPSQSGSITISGERNAVLEAKEYITKFIQVEMSTYSSSVQSIPKIKQKFLSPDEIFVKTGVVASPSEDESDTVQLFGPGSNIYQAKDELIKQANNLNVLKLDISKAHGKSINHARNLAQYLKHTNKLDGIEKDHDVKITLPSIKSLVAEAQEVSLEIVGNNTENIKEAKKNVVSLVNSLGPHLVKVVDDLDPFFYGHVSSGSLLKTVKLKHFVNVIPAEDSTVSKDILLVYEGNPNQEEEDFAPGADEIKETLQQVDIEYFSDIRSKQQDIISKVMTVEEKNHKFILGPNGTTLNAIIKGRSESANEPLVVVTLGVADKSISGYEDSLNLTKDSVWIRGIKSEVDRVIKEIEEVIEESKDHERLSNYTTNFAFPVEHLNKLIGRAGANLTKIREEFGVKIDIDESGNGVIKGVKKNAEEAKARILSRGRKLADEVLLRLEIPNEHHASLIGQGGKFVKRLEEKYGVRIRFPKDQAEKTTSSSTNTSVGSDAPSHKNEVVIRGPSKGATKTKEELLDLLKYELEHNHSQTIKVPAKTLSRIIGRNGENINNIKDSTETRIEVGNGDEDPVSIEIIGTKAGVKEAIEKIQAVAKEVVETVTETIEVDPKYHGFLIGPGGSVMKEIIANAGGSSNSDELTSAQANRMIQVPQAGSTDPKIVISGNQKVVAKIIKQINTIVSDREKQVEIVVNVPTERHGLLIGPGGTARKELEDAFKITMLVPRQGSGDEGIKLKGQAEDVEKAKEKILSTISGANRSNGTKQQNGGNKNKVFTLDVEVPQLYHASLSDRGTFIRRLNSEFNVKVEHARIPLSDLTSIVTPSEAIGDVLITDNEDELAMKFKWTIIEDDKVDKNAADKYIKWKLRGSEENCQRAKSLIENTLKSLSKDNSTGYLWLADPSRYRLVIGPQGSRINAIRSETGCTITVPKSGNNKDEVITVRGASSNVEKAKAMILDSISK